jgi:N-acetylmuramoyl-L-alanine amidase
VLTLNAPYKNDAGILLFPQSFVANLRQSFEKSKETDLANLRIAAIIVDAGHGGKDPGATSTQVINGKSTKVVEKEITLNVAKRLQGRLKAAFPDKQILMTRSGDTYPTLEDRVEIANNVKLADNEAIIFISIHANASFNKTSRGYEVWYLSPDYRRDVLDKTKVTFAQNNTSTNQAVLSIFNTMLEEEYTTESIMMASSISSRIGEAFGKAIPSRGLKAEEWFVVRNARMPSVLVELGFVSNVDDAILLTTEGGLDKFAASLCKGLTDFITKFEASGGFIGG